MAPMRPFLNLAPNSFVALKLKIPVLRLIFWTLCAFLVIRLSVASMAQASVPAAPHAGLLNFTITNFPVLAAPSFSAVRLSSNTVFINWQPVPYANAYFVDRWTNGQ